MAADVQTLDDVLDRLGSIETSMLRQDGVWWFNHLYFGMTRAVADAVNHGKFEDRRDAPWRHRRAPRLPRRDDGATRHRACDPEGSGAARLDRHLARRSATSRVARAESPTDLPRDDSFSPLPSSEDASSSSLPRGLPSKFPMSLKSSSSGATTPPFLSQRFMPASMRCCRVARPLPTKALTSR